VFLLGSVAGCGARKILGEADDVSVGVASDVPRGGAVGVGAGWGGGLEHDELPQDCGVGGVASDIGKIGCVYVGHATSPLRLDTVADSTTLARYQQELSAAGRDYFLKRRL